MKIDLEYIASVLRDNDREVTIGIIAEIPKPHVLKTGNFEITVDNHGLIIEEPPVSREGRKYYFLPSSQDFIEQFLPEYIKSLDEKRAIERQIARSFESLEYVVGSYGSAIPSELRGYTPLSFSGIYHRSIKSTEIYRSF